MMDDPNTSRTDIKFNWVDSSVLEGIDQSFSRTFSNEKDSSLQLRRFELVGESDGDSQVLPYFCSSQITSAQDLATFAIKPDPCQIFCIRQRNSYSRLYITRGLFDQLLAHYFVFSRIWDFMLPFSFKTRESDIGHAPFRFRQTSEPRNGDPGSYECAYGFRYVELNHRDVGKKENPDYDPWSVRQSAIYQQYNSEYKRIMFILISPSENARKALEDTLRYAGIHKRALNAFDLHRTLISTLHENWRLYIRSLEALMVEQSERVILAQVNREDEKLSPLTDFAVNFVDRQRLKMIEDKVLDLVIIFESLYNTLSKLQRQCERHCLGPECKGCTCRSTIEELEEQMHEVQVNLKKAEVLHKRAKGTAQLLSDLLDYENAQIAHGNEKALNGLVMETKEENSKMRLLTERSTRDSTAVRILTVITLIYLPVTVVANFFSSQLIRVDSNGRLSLIAASWWFAIISVPLTVVTFFVWFWWIKHATNTQRRKQQGTADLEQQPTKESLGGGGGFVPS